MKSWKKSFRVRMYEYMRLSNYSPRTIKTYVCSVAGVSKDLGKSPDLISTEELKSYLFGKIEHDGLSPTSILDMEF